MGTSLSGVNPLNTIPITLSTFIFSSAQKKPAELSFNLSYQTAVSLNYEDISRLFDLSCTTDVHIMNKWPTN